MLKIALMIDSDVVGVDTKYKANRFKITYTLRLEKHLTACFHPWTRCVCVCVVAADLCRGSLHHFQLALVDLDAPEEAIKEPEEHPAGQPKRETGRRGSWHELCTYSLCDSAGDCSATWQVV